jgi:SprT protein
MSIDKKRTLASKIAPFVPEGYGIVLADFILEYKIKFKVVKSRKGRLGDYRAPFGEDKNHRITVNNDLNKFSFLITSLHEIAHLQNFIAHGRSVLPHGKEWQSAFAKLLQPLLADENIPKDVKLALTNTVKKVKASSCSDLALSRVLQRYDIQKENTESIENLKLGASFVFNGSVFVKGEKRRTRYLCTNTKTQRAYLFAALASVEIGDK